MTSESKLAETAFTQYRRKQIAELRPWQPGDDMTRISVSAEDTKAGSPKPGDMIARNPKNHADQWLVAATYFADNFEPFADAAADTGEPVALNFEGDPRPSAEEMAKVHASIAAGEYREMPPLGDSRRPQPATAFGECLPDWGQIVQTVLRCLDATIKNESSREQAERIADELERKYPTLTQLRATDAPQADQNEAIRDVRHALNEWADLGCNSIQWLKNIKDSISTPDDALAEMRDNYARVIELSRAAEEALTAARGADGEKSDGSPVNPDQGIASQHEYPGESRSGQNSSRSQSTPSDPADVTVLADAMWQLLDDMGTNGQSVCLAAKAQARVAYEPFRDKSEREYDDWISLADAERILKECDQ